MRIIAGKYRSRKLNTLPGLKTRPTLDKTKEAIFSSMGNYLPDYVVLDVFGGSGALSLEALSRGAKKAYIMDSNIEAINIIKSNKEALKVKDELVIYHNSYVNVLPTFIGKVKFDVVFLDPPRKGCDKTALDTILEIKPKRIVYVSCNPATLARDLKILEEKYELKDLSICDMFPFTHHVECVTWLELK